MFGIPADCNFGSRAEGRRLADESGYRNGHGRVMDCDFELMKLEPRYLLLYQAQTQRVALLVEWMEKFSQKDKVKV
jgi:hypothetical protein